ncbi:MAG: pseudouridine synthase [Saprospiraceae bacterium]|nr:pseudouridine synthase [Saprospiraceae bacterium]
MIKKKVFKYYKVYKPYGVLSQFTREHPDDQTLKDLYAFPPDVYPVGRLDKDSEGLLILTNDPTINQMILHPDQKKEKTYWVQVEGIPNHDFIQAMAKGIEIMVNQKAHFCLPALVKPLENTIQIPPRNPPVRYRQNIPATWISITLSEGKNRQIRKMCAKLGFPVLRLIRISIGNLILEELIPGKVYTIERHDCI